MYAKLFVPFLKMNNLQCMYIDIEKREIEINIWRKEMNKFVETAAVTRFDVGLIVMRVRWEAGLSIICLCVCVCVCVSVSVSMFVMY